MHSFDRQSKNPVCAVLLFRFVLILEFANSNAAKFLRKFLVVFVNSMLWKCFALPPPELLRKFRMRHLFTNAAKFLRKFLALACLFEDACK
jgi:hypothetical protein